MSRLLKWETPFADASFPSVWISIERILSGATIYVDAAELWQVSFDYIAGMKSCDESYDDNTRFHIERDIDGLCSYFWEDSPWLGQFDSKFAEVIEGNTLAHYVLLGGDYNVEVLALGHPKIILIDK